MPVNSMHSDYLANTGVRKRSRDVLSGEDAVKAAGEEYLPRLDSQSDEEFRAYVKRASFFNATSRTAEGYLGMIFRRELLVKSVGIPEGLLADVDLAATPLNGYAKRVVNEVVAVGRCGGASRWRRFRSCSTDRNRAGLSERASGSCTVNNSGNNSALLRS